MPDYARHLILQSEGDLVGRAGKAAQVIGEVPGEVACRAEIPEGEQATDLAGVLCGYSQSVRGQNGEFLGHN